MKNHMHHPLPNALRPSLAEALALADRRCAELGRRWTVSRQRALEILLEANGPVKVYDLLSSFKPGGLTAPATIYRAFEALVDLGMAHRIDSLNAYMARHFIDKAQATLLLVCDQCGRVDEVAPPTPALLTAIKAHSTFLTETVAVEAHGCCGDCRA
ncbi:MAG: Fur family transcriptional regulator [Caulobacter sp.]|nr:Fur family transcriptional regulator [Caulobacter sp.]